MGDNNAYPSRSTSLCVISPSSFTRSPALYLRNIYLDLYRRVWHIVSSSSACSLIILEPRHQTKMPSKRTFMDVAIGDAAPQRIMFELDADRVPKTVEK